MANLKTQRKQFEEIAKRFGIETLNARNLDSLDFHELAVWRIEAMLQAAYELGVNHARKAA